MFRGEAAIDARHLMAMHGKKLVSNEVEAKVLALILNEERDTCAFAEALGIDPAGPDAEKTVKQVKDRIQVRIKRLRDEVRGRHRRASSPALRAGAASGPAPLIAALLADWRRGFERDPARDLGVGRRVLSELASTPAPPAG